MPGETVVPHLKNVINYRAQFNHSNAFVVKMRKNLSSQCCVMSITFLVGIIYVFIGFNDQKRASEKIPWPSDCGEHIQCSRYLS
jgi:type II secretory pathway component PulF